MVTAGAHCRVYTPPSKESEWSPRIVRPEGKIASVKEGNSSIVYDETWIIKNGHIVRG